MEPSTDTQHRACWYSTNPSTFLQAKLSWQQGELAPAPRSTVTGLRCVQPHASTQNPEEPPQQALGSRDPILPSPEHAGRRQTTWHMWHLPGRRFTAQRGTERTASSVQASPATRREPGQEHAAVQEEVVGPLLLPPPSMPRCTPRCQAVLGGCFGARAHTCWLPDPPRRSAQPAPRTLLSLSQRICRRRHVAQLGLATAGNARRQLSRREGNGNRLSPGRAHPSRDPKRMGREVLPPARGVHRQAPCKASQGRC